MFGGLLGWEPGYIGEIKYSMSVDLLGWEPGSCWCPVSVVELTLDAVGA